jgi:transposase-like protein
MRWVQHYTSEFEKRWRPSVDFRLSARRDVAAAKGFFRKAMRSQRRAPKTITLDDYAASHRAVRELKADGSLPTHAKLRSSKYFINLIEQGYRSVKQRIGMMLGLRQFRNAAITIAGIELIHKWQFRCASRSGPRTVGVGVAAAN